MYNGLANIDALIQLTHGNALSKQEFHLDGCLDSLCTDYEIDADYSTSVRFLAKIPVLPMVKKVHFNKDRTARGN